MEVFGYALAVLMGFSLGLLGGGGSILTVPILVYVMGVEPVLATAYSLFVVGTTSAIGAIRKHFQGLIAWQTGFYFAIPSLVAVFLTRYYILPALPSYWGTVGDHIITKDIVIMAFFGVIMLLASYSMIKGRAKVQAAKEDTVNNIVLIILEGLVVGVITGLVGAGGGFLIVPALVILLKLPVKKAIGTSLFIIALKSLIGFLGDISTGRDMEWELLILFSAFSILGMFLGIYATRYASPDKLRKGFGWFVLVMAILILVKESFF